MNEEREAVLAYLRSNLIPSPINEAEKFCNQTLSAIIGDIERAMHRVHAGGEL